MDTHNDETKNVEPTSESVMHKAQNKKSLLIGLGLVVFLIVAAGVTYWFTMPTNEVTNNEELYNQVVSTGEPFDIVSDFYERWLDAAQSTTTDPYQLGLQNNELLSQTLRAQLQASVNRTETEIDPVLCQTNPPEKIGARTVFETPEMVSVLVAARDKTQTAQSVVTLKRLNDGWYIDSISCTPGEFELPREFTFEKEGFILKNVPPPYDSQFWHIVYEENGVPGHAAALFFNASSSCAAWDGSQMVCNPTQFTEGFKIRVFGQMTESGIDVNRLEMLDTLE